MSSSMTTPQVLLLSSPSPHLFFVSPPVLPCFASLSFLLDSLPSPSSLTLCFLFCLKSSLLVGLYLLFLYSSSSFGPPPAPPCLLWLCSSSPPFFFLCVVFDFFTSVCKLLLAPLLVLSLSALVTPSDTCSSVSSLESVSLSSPPAMVHLLSPCLWCQ